MLRLCTSVLLLLAPLLAQPPAKPRSSAKSQPATANDAEMEQQLKRFIDAFATISAEAADELTAEAAFYTGAIPGMLRQLDPHSVFFDPAQFNQLKQMENSESKGFGSVVSVLPGRVIFLQTLAGTPSAKAGLQPGDEIVAIGPYELARMEFDQIVQLLGEARQHEIELVVRRSQSVRLLNFRLKPEIMDSPSVDRAFLLSTPGIGYLRVTSFDVATGKLVKETIEKLGGASLKGLVIDLRNNPGGVATAAADIASLFLKPGQPVFTIEGRKSDDASTKDARREEIDVPKDAKPYDFPVAILINGKSASASEIVTGALQDHDRALVFGEPSFGKGLVQNVFPLSQQAALALTIAFYYIPSGRSIQKPLRAGGQLDSATVLERKEYKTDAGRIVRGGGGVEPDEVVVPEIPGRLGQVLEATASFTNFATEALQKYKIDESFKVDGKVLDDFRVFLSERSIQPSVPEFLKIRDWTQSRLQQEIMTQAIGLSKGDEVEAERDPVIRRAVARLAAKP